MYIVCPRHLLLYTTLHYRRKRLFLSSDKDEKENQNEQASAVRLEDIVVEGR